MADRDDTERGASGLKHKFRELATGVYAKLTRAALEDSAGNAINPAKEDGNLAGLTDDAIKGVLRTLGDAGATPANTSGETLLKRVAGMKDVLYYGSDQHSANGAQTGGGGALTVDLDLGEFRFSTTVNVWMKSDGEAIESSFVVYAKNGSGTWRKVETVAITHDEQFKTYQIAARNFRVTVADNAAARSIEIFGR